MAQLVQDKYTLVTLLKSVMLRNYNNQKTTQQAVFTPPPVLKTNDKARSWLYRAVVDDNQRQIRDTSTKYSRDRAKKNTNTNNKQGFKAK